MEYHEVRDQLLNAIDEATSNGQWQVSLFYKNILKQLTELRAYVVSKLGEAQAPKTSGIDGLPAQVITSQSTMDDWAEGYEKVYVSLYQFAGERMDRWLNMVKLLPEHYVGRPIYRQLEHIQEWIRSKRCRAEAYAIVWVKTENIIPCTETAPQDRFGHEFLTLKAGSIRLENLVAFVHDGKSYRLVEEQLVECN